MTSADNNFHIPFNNFKEEFHEIKTEVIQSIKKVLKSGIFINGKYQTKFEEQFANYCNVKYCFGVSSGTEALYIALKAMRVSYGDEVIIPANSYIATAVAVSLTGAKPVLVDIEESFYNIDPALIEEKISQKTKAIIAVHLYGQIAQMEAIFEIAKKNHLYILEDASQAYGSRYKSKTAGGLGDLAAFSFYPTKNLGAYGGGGAITTNSNLLAKRIELFKNSGERKRFYSVEKGLHSNLDEMEAAILLVKLPYLNRWNKLRQSHAYLYNKLLENTPVITPLEMVKGAHNYHLYVIRVKRRNELREFLSKHNIKTDVHYPTPMHLQPCYRELSYSKGDFSISERCAREIISLPNYPSLKDEEINHVVKKINDFFKGSS